jgi:hypothetical protein
MKLEGFAPLVPTEDLLRKISYRAAAKAGVQETKERERK